MMIQNAPDRPSQDASGPTPRSFRVGEPFNPWHQACGFYPPDVVGRQRDLTDGQKRLYERSVRWAGQNGIFWWGFEAMADALGKSQRQVKDDMAALETIGLIRHIRRRRNSNVYSFLWHAMFEVQPTALQKDGFEVQDSILEVQDKVVLKVQPTARESSQLESCHVNCVKADKKRIPGFASQKQRSAASSSVKPAREEPKNKPLEADWAPVSVRDPTPPAVGSPSKSWTPTDLTAVRRRIVTFWRREPEKGFEVSVMLRARGASADAVCALLDRKYANPNCRVGGRYAPKNQNWFLTVVENEFTPGHLPEPPARPQGDHDFEPDLVSRGIEAIELPDASRSIVESVRCDHCGGQALVRYTDGKIEGCRCRDRGGGTLRRITVTSALGIRSGSPHRRSVGD